MTLSVLRVQDDLTAFLVLEIVSLGHHGIVSGVSLSSALN